MSTHFEFMAKNYFRVNRFRGLKSSLILTLTAFLFFSCSKTDDKTTSTDATFSSIYTKILSVNCVTCHTTGGGSSGVSDLDFSSQTNAYNDLMGTVKKQSTCTSLRRVEPSTPSRSYVLALLIDDYNKDNFAGVTNCKPPVEHITNTRLNSTDKLAIIDWISAGASK